MLRCPATNAHLTRLPQTRYLDQKLKKSQLGAWRRPARKSTQGLPCSERTRKAGHFDSIQELLSMLDDYLGTALSTCYFNQHIVALAENLLALTKINKDLRVLHIETIPAT